MGTITRSFANNITTSGVLLPASLTNNSIANVTAYNAAIATGNMVLISSQTATNSTSIAFTTGIDSTYKEYQFWFINMMPKSSNDKFYFNASTDGGSNYNVVKTTTLFRAYHDEVDSATGLDYITSDDLAQSTAYQEILRDSSANSDENSCGYMSLFNPASTTYVKHFIAVSSGAQSYALNSYTAGYLNTTSAINAINFKFSVNNCAGTILMYGIK